MCGLCMLVLNLALVLSELSRADVWPISTVSSAVCLAGHHGVVPVLTVQGAMMLTQRQLLKGMDGATVHIVVKDHWLVALNTTCVIGAAAEDAGLLCLPGAVSTLVAVLVTSITSEVMQSMLC